MRGESPEEKEGYDGKDLQKRKVSSLEWKSEGWWMDGTNGIIGLGESELERLVSGWRREAGSRFHRRREAYWKERYMLYVEKMT